MPGIRRPRVGVVFGIPIGDGRFGIGQVLSYDHLNLYYVAVLHAIVSDTTTLSLEDALHAEVECLVGCTLEGVELGLWPVLGELPSEAQALPRPCYLIVTPGGGKQVVSFDGSRKREATPVEAALLRPRTTHSSGILVDAVRAIAGERTWDERLDAIRMSAIAEQASVCQG